MFSSTIESGLPGDVRAVTVDELGAEVLSTLFPQPSPSETMRLIEINGAPFLQSATPSLPWHRLEVPGQASWTANTGPLSLRSAKVAGIECPAIVIEPPPLSKPSDLAAGDQLQFTSECTSARETTWAHDQRTGLVHPQTTLRSSLNKDKQIHVLSAAQKRNTSNLKSGQNGTESSSAPATKRKERSPSPEIEVVVRNKKRPKAIPKGRKKTTS